MWQFIPALVGAVGGAIASAEGSSALSEAEKKAAELIQKSIREYESIGLPTEEALKVSLQETRRMGILTPNLENIINQNPTEMLGVQTDPRLRDAQMAALGELRGVGESGGMRLSDIANYQRAMGDVAQRERGAREAILMDQAQRGASTGGGSLAAQLLNDQANSQSRYQAGLDLAGRAQDVALRSILESGQLGGQIQNQDFEQQSQKAQAQDIINRMNTEAARGVQQRNVNYMNDAQASNLSEAQRIFDANTDTRNQQTLYNAKVPQQMFENALTKQDKISGLRTGQANQALQSGQGSAQMWGGIGSGLLGAGVGISDSMLKNKGVQTKPATENKNKKEDY